MINKYTTEVTVKMSMSDYDEFAEYVKTKETDLRNLQSVTNTYKNLCKKILDTISLDRSGEIAGYSPEGIKEIYKQANEDYCPF